ncbi:MAG: hypothetical protein ACI4LO_08590 [Anaerovoracaceae bacterium]
MTSIILPIKEEYIEKIFSGEKRVEYRKCLCKKDISNIYMYATSPVCKVVGEVKVLGKMILPKEDMWERTEKISGTEKSYFDKYFNNYSNASAYKLGESIRYEKGKKLIEFGIDYTIQSFKYIEE